MVSQNPGYEHRLCSKFFWFRFWHHHLLVQWVILGMMLIFLLIVCIMNAFSKFETHSLNLFKLLFHNNES